MNAAFPGSRTLWVALAAIAGILSLAGDASACRVSDAAPAGRSCCVGRSPADCCCKGPVAAPERTATAPAPIGASRPSLGIPSPGCECRPGEPTAPTDRPAQRVHDDRPDAGRAYDLAPGFVPVPGLPPASRPIEPTASPPKAPIYLRTARLLI